MFQLDDGTRQFDSGPGSSRRVYERWWSTGQALCRSSGRVFQLDDSTGPLSRGRVCQSDVCTGRKKSVFGFRVSTCSVGNGQGYVYRSNIGISYVRG